MKDRIEFVETEEVTRRVVLEDRWKFQPSGRLAPLLRRVFGWMVRKGHLVNAIDEKIAFKRHVVHPSSVVEALFRQREAAMSALQRGRATTVLMGPEDYSELMCAPEFHQYVTFNAEARDQRGVLGLTIKVIPWMRGVLVVP